MRIADHHQCVCGHIRADHAQLETKGIVEYRECRGAFRATDGRKHPCQCDYFQFHASPRSGEEP